MTNEKSLPVVPLVVGSCEVSPIFHLDEPLSFWGGLDPTTGHIIDRAHPQAGWAIGGAVLVMSAGRGSSSGSSVLAEALRAGTGPRGIVLRERDAIVTVGAMVANELYDLRCPVVLTDDDAWAALAGARSAAVEATDTTASVRFA